MVLHAGGSEGWVPNCFYLSAKNTGDAKADSHDDMNSDVFENWFKRYLIKNIPENEKCIIVLDNASYNLRKSFRIPTMSAKKDEMLKFMEDHNIEIPYPVPIKSVLLMKIKGANINTKYIVVELAAEKELEIHR
ncbi:hypothetical protein C0J52_11777 [Blattella germanica]|nr:hypothetical protein C0J52_11777 [Blattella germanica]